MSFQRNTRVRAAAAALWALPSLLSHTALGAAPYFDRPLVDVIAEFRAAGLVFVYSTNLVSDDLRVRSEPESEMPLDIMREILADHGLELAASGDVQLIVRVRGDREAEPARGGAAATLQPERPSAPKLEEVTVSASRYDISRDGAYEPAYFDRAEIESLADLGGDPLRVMHRLPGTASDGYSAKSHIRGGDTGEMSIIFDGLELIDPFHARDFQSLFSVLDHRAIADVQIHSGGFPASFGDSLSGIMLIEPRSPERQLVHELALSLLTTSVLSSGAFGGGDADWLASVRRSNLDLVVDRDIGRPRYGDAFAHVATKLGPKTRVSINGLVSEDDIAMIAENDGPDQENSRSDTSNQQFWLKLDNEWNERLKSSTIVSSAHFSNIRAGLVVDPEEIDGSVRDARALDAVGLKQDWQWRASSRQYVQWGFDAKRLQADYAYESSRRYFGLYAAFDDAALEIDRQIALKPGGESLALYVSDRLAFGSRIVAELGLRWDKQTYLPVAAGDDQLSPRLGLLYRIGPRTDIRTSWGRFFQSQDILELDVQDGVESFFPAQLAEHSIVSVEHRFTNELALRVEAYRKNMPEQKPRYENVFETLVLLPELQPDRIRIVPERARAHGVEVLLEKERPDGLRWWASYTRATVEDVIDGRPAPRNWDQRHAATAGVSGSVEKWTLTAAASYRTGRPVTALELESRAGAEGAPSYRIAHGRRNADRLGSLARVDVRASRAFDVRPGELEISVEVTNLLNRKNPCCVDYDVETDDAGSVFLERSLIHTLPRVTSVGVRWAF